MNPLDKALKDLEEIANSLEDYAISMSKNGSNSAPSPTKLRRFARKIRLRTQLLKIIKNMVD